MYAIMACGKKMYYICKKKKKLSKNATIEKTEANAFRTTSLEALDDYFHERQMTDVPPSQLVAPVNDTNSRIHAHSYANSRRLCWSEFRAPKVYIRIIF